MKRNTYSERTAAACINRVLKAAVKNGDAYQCIYNPWTDEQGRTIATDGFRCYRLAKEPNGIRETWTADNPSEAERKACAERRDRILKLAFKDLDAGNVTEIEAPDPEAIAEYIAQKKAAGWKRDSIVYDLGGTLPLVNAFYLQDMARLLPEARWFVANGRTVGAPGQQIQVHFLAPVYAVSDDGSAMILPIRPSDDICAKKTAAAKAEQRERRISDLARRPGWTREEAERRVEYEERRAERDAAETAETLAAIRPKPAAKPEPETEPAATEPETVPEAEAPAEPEEGGPVSIISAGKTNASQIFNARCELLARGIIRGTGRTVEIITNEGPAKVEEPEEIHTFARWQEMGYTVRKGERAVCKLAIWLPKEADGSGAKPDDVTRIPTDADGNAAPDFTRKTSYFFAASQVERADVDDLVKKAVKAAKRRAAGKISEGDYLARLRSFARRSGDEKAFLQQVKAALQKAKKAA